MDKQEPDSTVLSTPGTGLWLFIAGVLILILGMAASIYYPFPNGKSLSLGDFIALWLREILILLGLLVAVVVGGVSWLRKTLRERTARDKNAP
jgi:hypothetical protein